MPRTLSRTRPLPFLALTFLFSASTFTQSALAADGVTLDDAVSLHLIDGRNGIPDIHESIRRAWMLPLRAVYSKFIEIIHIVMHNQASG